DVRLDWFVVVLVTSHVQLPLRAEADHCSLFDFSFSSRRRHTSSKRDWSSDVCSSDLGGRGRATAGRPRERRGERRTAEASHGVRSEERRVGKEWRTGRAEAHSKRKKRNNRTGGRKEGEKARLLRRYNVQRARTLTTG